MTSLGNITLFRKDGTPVQAVVEEHSARSGFGSSMTIFTISDAENHKSIGRISMDGKKIQGLNNDTDKLGLKKIDGVMKVFMECVVVEKLKKKSRTLEVQASGGRSPWAYMACQFLPTKEIMITSMHRFIGAYRVYEKITNKDPLDKPEEEAFQAAKSELAKERGVDENTLALEDICFGDRREIMPKVFKRSREENKPIKLECPSDVLMYLPEEGFEFWEKRILKSSLKHDADVVQSLRKKYSSVDHSSDKKSDDHKSEN